MFVKLYEIMPLADQSAPLSAFLEQLATDIAGLAGVQDVQIFEKRDRESFLFLEIWQDNDRYESAMDQMPKALLKSISSISNIKDLKSWVHPKVTKGE